MPKPESNSALNNASWKLSAAQTLENIRPGLASTLFRGPKANFVRHNEPAWCRCNNRPRRYFIGRWRSGFVDAQTPFVRGLANPKFSTPSTHGNVLHDHNLRKIRTIRCLWSGAIFAKRSAEARRIGIPSMARSKTHKVADHCSPGFHTSSAHPTFAT